MLIINIHFHFLEFWSLLGPQIIMSIAQTSEPFEELPPEEVHQRPAPVGPRGRRTGRHRRGGRRRRGGRSTSGAARPSRLRAATAGRATPRVQGGASTLEAIVARGVQAGAFSALLETAEQGIRGGLGATQRCLEGWAPAGLWGLVMVIWVCAKA